MVNTPSFTAWAIQSQAKHDEQQLAFFNVLKCPSPKIFYFLIWNYTLLK